MDRTRFLSVSIAFGTPSIPEITTLWPIKANTHGRMGRTGLSFKNDSEIKSTLVRANKKSNELCLVRHSRHARRCGHCTRENSSFNKTLDDRWHVVLLLKRV